MSIDESEEEKPKKKVTKAKAAPKPTTRKAPAAKKSTAKKNAQNVEDDDIVDSDEVSLPTKRGKVGNQEVALPPPPSLPPSQATQGKTKRMLPLSFSQVSTTSKGKSNSKTVDLSWDD